MFRLIFTDIKYRNINHFFGLFMETSATSLSNNNHIIQQAGFMQKAGVYTSSDLTLRTREGDIVTLATRKDLEYSESGQITQFDDGAVQKEFSTSALAASKYSLMIQGELNEEEFAAIEQLVRKISPVAQNFFGNSGFDVKEATDAIIESMGVIDQVSLKLEQTTVKAVSSQYYTEKGIEESTEPLENIEVEAPSLLNASIRDIPALVQAVVESLFHQTNAESIDNNTVLQSISDLIEDVNSRLIQLMDPLDNLNNIQHDEIAEAA